MNLEFGNNKQTWNIVIGACLVTMLGIAIGDMLIPKPNAARERKRFTQETQKIKAEINEGEQRLATETVTVQRYTYKGDPETVTPKILDHVNQLAKTNAIKVKSFRPQKAQEADGIVRIPYTVQVEGKYKDVVAFIKSVDEPSTLFSVNLLQLSAADGESDTVNATVGISAFSLLPEKVKETPTNG